MNWKGCSSDLREINRFLEDTLPDRDEFLSGSFSIQEKPYRLHTLREAQEVGVAFDYLARFEVARKISDIITKRNCKTLLAQKAIKKLWDNGYKYECNRAISLYDWSLSIIDEYIQNKGNHSYNKIIDIAFFLSHLEMYVRDNIIDKSTILDGCASSIEREDTQELVDTFRDRFISKYVSSTSTVVYNPKFVCYGLADADIYIDGCLYDFKTTKNAEYNEKYAIQIWKYALLHEIDIKNHALGEFQQYNIDSIALYKARFGITERVDLTKYDMRQYAIELEHMLLKCGLCRIVE